MAESTETDSTEPELTDQERNWRKLEERAKKAEERATKAERELIVKNANVDHLSARQLATLSREVEAEGVEWSPETVRSIAHDLFGVGPTGESTPAEPEPDHGDEAAELAAAATSSTGTPDAGPNRPPTQDEMLKAITPHLGDDEALVNTLEAMGFDGNW